MLTQQGTAKAIQTQGLLLRSLHEDCRKVFTDPLRSLLSGRPYHYERHSKQPICCLQNKNQISTAKNHMYVLNRVPNFVPASASLTELYLTSRMARATGESSTAVQPLPGDANQLYPTGSPAVFVVRRFESTTLEGGVGYRHQSWGPLRQKFCATKFKQSIPK